MLNIARYIVAPYRFNGRDFSGCDCYGLVILWFRHELNIELIDHQHGRASHSEFTDTGYFTEKAHEEFSPVPIEDARLHDVVLIRTGSLTANHCGIKLMGDCILHTMQKTGCITSKLSLWRNKIVGIYRHKGLK